MPTSHHETRSGNCLTTDSEKACTLLPAITLKRAWRTQLIGGLVLSLAMFLPAFSSASGHRTDLDLLVRRLSSPVDWGGLFHAYCGYVARYVFGTLVFLPLVIPSRNILSSLKACSVICVWFSLPAILWTAYLSIDFLASSPSIMSLYDWNCCIVPIVIAAYITMCIFRGHDALVCAKLAIAVLFAIEFLGRIAYVQNALIGTHLAEFGVIIIAVGSFNEIRARTLTSIPQTLVQLITANPKFVDNDPTKCSYCGYNITHLTTPRCPECGQPFTPLDP